MSGKVTIEAIWDKRRENRKQNKGRDSEKDQ